MSCCCHDQWLPAPYFCLMFCHKLCLPIYSSMQSTCTCSKPLDEFGNHFFSCQCYHPKTPAHNAIQDVLHLIISEIGMHAGLITSHSSVCHELLNLAQCYPTSHPGDLLIECKPTYVSPPTLPFSCVAIDIHVTISLPSPFGGDQNSTVTITQHHQKVEHEKFCGLSINMESTFMNGEMVICALNDTDTVLLPFIVDPFGGLGPIVTAFLFGLQPNPLLQLIFLSATSQMAYDNAVSKLAPFAITACTDHAWSHHALHLPFGHTYHSWFPTNWSRQVLGVMINSSFAQHLYTNIWRDNTATP